MPHFFVWERKEMMMPVKRAAFRMASCDTERR